DSSEQINSGTPATNITSGSYADTGVSVIISDPGLFPNNPQNRGAITNGMSLTPAQWMATIQVAQSGNQTLSLNSSGNAASGSFTIASGNVPGGGFGSLVLPGGVTANATVSSLSYSGTTDITGSVSFTSAGSLTSGGALTVIGPGQITAGAGLTISAP